MPSARAARLKLSNCATFTKTAMSFRSAMSPFFHLWKRVYRYFHLIIGTIVLQGIEAGGHRGIFDASGLDQEIPTFQLLDACVSKLGTQLIAAGGILDSNGIQAALRKGAQAVQMGTAFLACHEAGTSNPYRAKLLDPSGRKTRTTRVFSGRLARGMENRFMEEMQTRSILPFPAQNSFTRDIRSASAAKRSADFLFALVGYRQR